MIEYEYKCNCCHHQFSVRQSIKDKPLKQCHCCQQYQLERIISGGICSIISKEPTTVGQLAEQNTRKMGKYELQEKRAAHKQAEQNAKREARKRASEKIGVPIPEMPEERPTPWYGKPDYDKINKMTPEQKAKYILEGK